MSANNGATNGAANGHTNGHANKQIIVLEGALAETYLETRPNGTFVLLGTSPFPSKEGSALKKEAAENFLEALCAAIKEHAPEAKTVELRFAVDAFIDPLVKAAEKHELPVSAVKSTAGIHIQRYMQQLM